MVRNMNSLNETRESSQPLTEEFLKSFARHITTFLPNNEEDYDVTIDDINKIVIKFSSIIDTALTPALAASHRVAALNALCALIDQVVASNSAQIAEIVWSRGIWNRTFELYLTSSQYARPKSAKQVLVTLTSALCSVEVPEDTKLEISRRLVEGISSWNDIRATKAAVLALGQFLRKEVLSMAEITSDDVWSENEAQSCSARCQSLISYLLHLASEGDFGSAVGQTFQVILDKFARENKPAPLDHGNVPLWAPPLKKAVLANRIDIGKLRIHLFPILFRRSLDEVAAFLGLFGHTKFANVEVTFSIAKDLEPGVSEILLCAALQAGMDIGRIEVTNGRHIEQTAQRILLPTDMLASLLSRSSSNARLAGLAMLVNCPVITRPYPTKTFQFLRHSLPSFFASTDPYFRGEVFTAMQKLIDRIRAITTVLVKKVDTSTDTLAILEHHKAFVSWLVQFICWELRPTASYQHHISALKTLNIIIRSGIDPTVNTNRLSKSASKSPQWPLQKHLLTTGLQNILLTLLADPFDDVRQNAVEILSLLTPGNDGQSLLADLTCAANRVQAAIHRTGRADQADGFAHLAHLIHFCSGIQQASSIKNSLECFVYFTSLVQHLESMLDVAKVSLIKATQECPVHGHLIALRYIIESSLDQELNGTLLGRIVECLNAVWSIVKPILCNDAPEGFKLDDAVVTEVSTKDTLSYCWRALKESSLLLCALVTRKSLPTPESEILCQLCFIQLAELRHRGAFSTVAQSWTACCLRQNDEQWLFYYYQKVIDILSKRLTINTRRSAGIPALLTGLLIADRNGKLIQIAFDELNTIACRRIGVSEAPNGSLPQVHAMNCIKDILTTTRLAERSESYISRTTTLAAQALQSEAWAIRNCGLMLFRAVIDRLLGTSDAHLEDDFPPRTLSAQQYHELFVSIMGLLKVQDISPGTESTCLEAVFPALQLISRMNINGDQLLDAQAAVLDFTASKAWHVRDKAARTYAALSDPTDVAGEIDWLFSIATVTDQNALHGLLLTAKYSILKWSSHFAAARTLTEDRSNIGQEDDEIPNRLLMNVVDSGHLYKRSRCMITKAAFVDILAEVLTTVNTQSRFSKPQLPALRAEKTCGIIKEILEDALFLNARSDSPSLRNGISPHGKKDSKLIQEPAVLRASVAHLLPLLLPDESLEGEVDVVEISRQQERIVKHFCTVDPDASCILYEDLRYYKNNAPNTLPHKRKLVQLALDEFPEALNKDVAATIQGTLLDSLPQPLSVTSAQVSAMQHLDFTTFSILATKLESIACLTQQESANNGLVLRAVNLNLRIARDSAPIGHSIGYLVDLENLVQDFQRAINSTGLYTVEAVGRAISGLSSTWTYLSANSSYDSHVLLKLCIILYDLLNDDDEDIRISAANTVCQILEANGIGRLAEGGLEPLKAGQNLIRFVTARWNNIPYLAKVAYTRAFRGSDPTAMLSPMERLNAAKHPDIALFAEEKQNLYIDEAREAKLWTQVLLRLNPMAVPRTVVMALTEFVKNGLEELLDMTHPERIKDLQHLSTDPDVFVLGLQVIYGVEVLLSFVEHEDNKLPVRPSLLRQMFLAFAKAAGLQTKESLHILWRFEIERVLRLAVVQTMKVAHRRLQKILI